MVRDECYMCSFASGHKNNGLHTVHCAWVEKVSMKIFLFAPEVVVEAIREHMTQTSFLYDLRVTFQQVKN